MFVRRYSLLSLKFLNNLILTGLSCKWIEREIKEKALMRRHIRSMTDPPSHAAHAAYASNIDKDDIDALKEESSSNRRTSTKSANADELIERDYEDKIELISQGMSSSSHVNIQNKSSVCKKKKLHLSWQRRYFKCKKQKTAVGSARLLATKYQRFAEPNQLVIVD